MLLSSPASTPALLAETGSYLFFSQILKVMNTSASKEVTRVILAAITAKKKSDLERLY